MDNSVSGGHDLEVVEGGLSPLQECEPLFVSLELKRFVLVLGVRGACHVHLDGVVDDQVHLAKRVDLFGVSAHFAHGSSHRSEVDYCGHAGEVLKDDSGGLERNLQSLFRSFLPAKDSLDVLLFDGEFVAVPHGTFKQHSDGVRQFLQASVS